MLPPPSKAINHHQVEATVGHQTPLEVPPGPLIDDCIRLIRVRHMGPMGMMQPSGDAVGY